MNALAVYYVNQHLMDLQEEARQAHLAKRARGEAKPSLLNRAVGAVRSAFGAGSTETSPTAASAA